MASFPDDTSWWIKVDAVDIVSGLGERYLDISLEFVTASKSYQLEIVLYSLT